MIVQFNPSALRQTRWYEYVVRFLARRGDDGRCRPHRGLLRTRRWRPVSAFPAIFPASATLIEKHVRERKEKAGLRGARRGKEAAALDAAGAALGSFGLAAFGLVIWLMIVHLTRLGARSRGSVVARGRDARMAGAAMAGEG